MPVDGSGSGRDIGRLRAEVGERLSAAGIVVKQRYVSTSAHVTIARFITPQLERATMGQWVTQLDELRKVCRQWQGQWCLADGPLQVVANKSWYGGGDVVIQKNA